MLTIHLQQTTEDVNKALQVVKQKTDGYKKDIENVIKSL